MRPIGVWLFLHAVLIAAFNFADAQTTGSIKIAGMFDLSGSGQIWGRAERNAFLMAIGDFKSNNPNINVVYTVEDSMFSNRQAVTSFQKLVAVDHYQYLIGPTWEPFYAIMPLCEAKKVVCMATSIHGREFKVSGLRYSFTGFFEDSDYTSALVERMNQRNHSTIVVFAAITPYYDYLVDNFLAKTKVSPSYVQRIALEEQDFRTLIAKAPKNVDAVLMLLDNAGQIQAFVKQWSEGRKDKPVIYSDDLVLNLDPPADLKKYKFPIVYAAPYFENGVFEQFSLRYEKHYGVKPGVSSAPVTYDETMIVLECAKQNPEIVAVRNCIAETKDYSGVSGRFSFDGGQEVRGREIRAFEMR